jgi:hypothetical protein
MSVADWMGVMADKCGDHGPNCLKVRKDFIDHNECTDEEGTVEKQNPPLGDGNVKVAVGSRVTLEISCPPDESTEEGESTEGESNESNEQSESNESTNGSGTDQTSESATTDQSDE